MTQKWTRLIMGGFMMLAFGAAFAHPPAPSHDYREYREPRPTHHRRPPPEADALKDRIRHQERAILAAQRKGALTQEETRTVRHNLAKIKTAYLRAKQSDQYISWHERQHLDDMLDRNHRMIERMKDHPIQPF
jgi:hypothetical protein